MVQMTNENPTPPIRNWEMVTLQFSNKEFFPAINAATNRETILKQGMPT